MTKTSVICMSGGKTQRPAMHCPRHCAFTVHSIPDEPATSSLQPNASQLNPSKTIPLRMSASQKSCSSTNAPVRFFLQNTQNSNENPRLTGFAPMNDFEPKFCMRINSKVLSSAKRSRRLSHSARSGLCCTIGFSIDALNALTCVLR